MARQRSDVDGGWAYMVALGNTLSFFIIAGFFRSFGILYSAFLDTFQRSDSATSLLLTMRSVCSIVIGPLSTSLSERFTERKVVIVGAIITSLGFSLSFFATSLEFLIGTIGVLQGIGSNLLIGPLIVAMGKYFDKKKSRAFTLTSCGGCVGMIVVPILLQKLIEMYSVRGALLIFGGLSFHLIITGAVIRPIKIQNTQLEEHTTGKAAESLSEVSFDKKKKFLSNGVMFEKALNGHNKTNGMASSARSSHAEHKFAKLEHNVPETEICVPEGEMSKETELYNLNRETKIVHIEMDVKFNTETNPTNIKRKSRTQKFYKSFLEKISLLKNPLFVIILLSGVVSAVPHSCITMYLVPLIESNGISRDSAAILLSVIGATDIIGRIVCGGLADRKPIQPQHVIIVTALLSGVTCSLLVVVTSFYGFLAVLIPYGLVCSAPNILIMPTIIQFVGRESLPKTVAILMFSLGLSTSIAPYLLGLLKDMTGSYRMIFPLFSCAYIFAGLVLLLEHLIRKRQKRKEETLSENSITSAVS